MMLSTLRRTAALLAVALLAGCASPLVIDDRYRAATQGPRVDMVILHYTALDFPTSLRVLTQQAVSSHYLVDAEPPTIYRLVDESRRASHAGVSLWDRRTMVNSSSIGIEIVNPGRVRGADGVERYVPYPSAQIDAVVALVRDITQRHAIPKERVVGHADIAPGRKQDPGPLFPWKRLADEGLAVWFDEARAAALRPSYEGALPDAAWFEQRLRKLGYGIGFERPPENALRDTLVSFQMRFRPSLYDGVADAETAAILAALTSP